MDVIIIVALLARDREVMCCRLLCFGSELQLCFVFVCFVNKVFYPRILDGFSYLYSCV